MATKVPICHGRLEDPPEEEEAKDRVVPRLGEKWWREDRNNIVEVDDRMALAAMGVIMMKICSRIEFFQ